MVPNKTLKSVYIPNYMEVSQSQKYSRYYVEANNKLTGYITSKVFDAWKTHTRRIRELKKRRANNMKKAILSEWMGYTTQKMINKARIDQHAKKYNYIRLLRTFMEMKACLSTKIDLKRRCNQYKALIVTRQLRRFPGFCSANYYEGDMYDYILSKQKQQEAY